MITWTSNELDKLGTAEELNLESLRQDGTLRNPVSMWVVRVGDDVFVRAYKGRDGAWFRGTQTRHQGRIQANGVEKEVTFVDETAPAIIDQVDAAYRTKYRKYSAEYVDPMLTDQAREATVKLVPR